VQQHVKIVAILHIVIGGLGILAGLVAMMFFGGLAHFVSFSNDEGGYVAGGILSLVGFFVMLVVLVISVPELIAGIGLLHYQQWARILTIVLSVLALPGFPLHTALGIYSLWVLLSNEGAALFDRRAVRAV